MQVRADLAVEIDQMMAKAGVSKAALFVVENPDSAFEIASARKPQNGDSVHLVLSSEILNFLSRDEVIAVLGHEIAHLAADDINNTKSRRGKEFQADQFGSELSRRPRSLATALPKIDLYLEDFKNRYLDEVLPGFLAKHGSVRRKMTESILRTAAKTTGYLTKSNYPTTDERLLRLASMDDHLSPEGTNSEIYADYLLRVYKDASVASRPPSVQVGVEAFHVDSNESSRVISTDIALALPVVKVVRNHPKVTGRPKAQQFEYAAAGRVQASA